MPLTANGLPFHDPGESRIVAIKTRDWQHRKNFKTIHSALPNTPITFSPDSRYLAYGSNAWEFQTGKTVNTSYVGMFSRFLNHTHLLTSDSGSIKVWEIEKEKLKRKATIRPATRSRRAKFLLEDDMILAVGESLSLRKASTGELIRNGIFREDFQSTNRRHQSGWFPRRGSESFEERNSDLGRDGVSSDASNPSSG